MPTEPTVCDRCMDDIQSGGSTFKAESGPLVRGLAHIGTVSLCSTCTAGLLAWMVPLLPRLEPTEPTSGGTAEP